MSENSNSYPGSAKDDKYQESHTSYKDEDEDSANEDEGKGDRGGKGKKKYSVIPEHIRKQFIDRVLSKEVTIKEAATEFGLKFSTSKAILQTYKKEGRIGKKKNRDRKTKILNAVFICNINPLNPYASTIYPIVSPSEHKNTTGMANPDANKNKLIEQTLNNYPDHKILHQTHTEIPYDPNRSTHQIIKDLGNDFLKDFIEKNYSSNKMQHGSMEMNPYNTNPNNYPGSLNNPSLSNQSLNGHPGMNVNQMSGQQQSFSMGNNLTQITGLNQFNQFNPGLHNSHINQKRQFSNYDKDPQHIDFALKNEQINEMSVKKFKSGENILSDFDFDKSQRDLEDFIYKTHTNLKNNTYIEKPTTFDFSKYRDESHE